MTNSKAVLVAAAIGTAMVLSLLVGIKMIVARVEHKQVAAQRDPCDRVLTGSAGLHGHRLAQFKIGEEITIKDTVCVIFAKELYIPGKHTVHVKLYLERKTPDAVQQ